MQRWKAAALASMFCSSVLSIWMCREGLLLSHGLGPALAPLRRPPRTLDARIARLAQCKLCPSLGESEPAPSSPTCEQGPDRGVGSLEGPGWRSGYSPEQHHPERVHGRERGRCASAPAAPQLSFWAREQRGERVRAQPCCRPTAYEDEVSFLDSHSRYHTVHELSARECACV
ncbi:Neurturin [Pteropus alecto]|uniref:Neurturin n=1 Tax=Pteropus alecto TaxID=9402 RepID=L5L6V0_PTEAL|nr:Neurturin [Pteropus alecto]